MAKKAKQFILIDGYNLVLASGLMKTLSGPGNVERARQRLLGWLAMRLDQPQRIRTTVVFDSHGYAADQPREVQHEITVLYSIGFPSADELLETLIRQHSAPKQLVVVSSDQRIQLAARRRKAVPLSSLTFFEQIESAPPEEVRASRSDTDDKEQLPNLNAFDPEMIQQLQEEIQQGRIPGKESKRKRGSNPSQQRRSGPRPGETPER